MVSVQKLWWRRRISVMVVVVVSLLFCKLYYKWINRPVLITPAGMEHFNELLSAQRWVSEQENFLCMTSGVTRSFVARYGPWVCCPLYHQYEKCFAPPTKRKEEGACCPSPKKEKYVMSGAAPLPHPYCATVYDTTLSALGILHMPTIITRVSLRMLKIHSTRCHSYSVTRFISLLTSIPSCAHWIGMGYAQESSTEALVSCWFLCKPVLNTAVLSCLS